MEFTEVLRRRRMIRTYSDRPLPREQIDVVVDAGLRAPSAGFSQGWGFVVLEGPEQTAKFWRHTSPTEDPPAPGGRWAGLRDAPAMVIPFSHKAAYLRRYAEADKAGLGMDVEDGWPVPFWDIDAAFAVMAMLLAATDAGLGALFFGIFHGETAMSAELGVPDGYRPIGAITLGWPAADDRPSPSLARGHRPRDEVVHYGAWQDWREVNRRTLIEVLIVALFAGGFAVAAATRPAVPKVVVGQRTWVVSWAEPAESAAAGGKQVTLAFADGRAHDQSLREVLDLSLGGQAVRVQFTNEYGDAPLVIAAAQVAPALPGGAMDGRFAHPLRFNGVGSTVIFPGKQVASDPVGLAVGSGEQLAVSMAVSGTSPSPTVHQFAGLTSAVSAPRSGNVIDHPDGHLFSIPTTAHFWLAKVEVLEPPGAARTVIALGDSQFDPYLLSDGEASTPELLRRRLEANPATAGLGVINSGLTGNTVTDIGCTICGTPMVDRVIRDAVDVAGASVAIVLGGTNDIGGGASAASVVHGLASVAAILHAHHLTAIGVTIPPRKAGAFGWRPATMDPVRRAVNGWLRATHDFDALIDADRLLADPVRPDRLAPRYDRGDGVHLSADGRLALATAIRINTLAS